MAQAVLALFSYLLARLIWLPFFFGLFFYLVSGLIVGGAAFRVARSARPISGGILFGGSMMVGIVTVCITTVFEYRHFTDTVADPPKFARARNAIVERNESLGQFEGRAGERFRHRIAEEYVGGPMGYALWTIRSGEMELTVDGETETITTDHAGLIWPIRTLFGLLLIGAGLWSSLEALRSASPVSNVLPPGAEYIEDDD